ncbi:MAG TPA: MMPL family transporter [Thermoanaerobaculia bacterium]|nr:MMPL family transporter [Thermoanaerobaculia bacterium]
MKRIAELVASLATRRSRTIVAIAVLLTTAAVIAATRLRLDPDILSLVPRSNREVNEFKTLLNTVKTLDQHLMVISLPQGTDYEDYLPLADDIANRFSKLPSVGSVEYRLPDPETLIERFLPKALLYLSPSELDEVSRRLSDAEIRSSVAQNFTTLQTPQGIAAKPLIQYDPFHLLPIFLSKFRSAGGGMKIDAVSGYYLSADHSLLLIVVHPVESAQKIPFATRLLADSDAIASTALAEWEKTSGNAPLPTIGFTGGYAIAVEDARLIRRDVLVNILVSFAGILALFIYAFRGVESVVYGAIPMAIAIALTFGLAALVLGRLSSASAVFGALVGGLGVDFVTILYSRYLDYRHAGSDSAEAITQTMRSTLAGIFIAAITTAATFYAYLATDYRGMSELGFLTGSGILIFFLCVVFLLPALITILESWRKKKTIGRLHTFGSERLIRASLARPGLTIAVWSIFIVLAAVASTRIDFDPEISSFRSTGNKAATLQSFVTSKLGQTFNAMTFAVKRPTLEAALAATTNSAQELDRFVKESVIGGYQGPSTLLPSPDAQRRAIERLGQPDFDVKRIEKTFRAALTENGFRGGSYDDYLLLFRKMISPDRLVTIADFEGTELAPLVRRFVRKSNDGWWAITYLYPHGKSWPSNVPPQLLEWRESRTGDILTGFNLVSMSLRQVIKRDALRGTMWGFVGVVILFILFTRSLLRGALMLVPLLAGGIGMLGVMATFHIRLNLVNAFVGLMLIGVATDYAIYIAQRFYENPDNLEVALGDTAKAVAMAAMTALWGFGSFVTSHFAGMRSIGYASIVGIGLSGLAAITLLPAILVRLFGSSRRASS